jgi:D-erythro-7,8-dihydroneopterin triphosphate epimerase
MSTAAGTAEEGFMDPELTALDAIHIKDLLLRCIIGINDNERVQKQLVMINITLFADLSTACDSDVIDDTVDYDTLKKQVAAMVEKSSFFLIEKLVNEIASICFTFKDVQAVRVLAEKPDALRSAKSAGVEIFRRKGYTA